ncbi:MAG TPA: DUF397 domain-containing protein [Micromonosporaceae bacterium]
MSDGEGPAPAFPTHSKGAFDLSRATWRRAPGDTSEGGVEVAFVDDLVGLRNSSQPDGPVLVFTTDEWDAFVAGAQDGEFDL